VSKLGEAATAEQSGGVFEDEPSAAGSLSEKARPLASPPTRIEYVVPGFAVKET